MEAKEIVAEEVARQAKFGYEPSWEDFVIAGQLARRNEVVEWVESLPITSVVRTAVSGFSFRQVDTDKWEAKLEEWEVISDA